MPGRHTQELKAGLQDETASRRRWRQIGGFTLLALAAGGIGLILALPNPTNTPSTASHSQATAASPTVGPGGICLGQYLAVPTTSWRHTSGSTHSATQFDLHLVNHGASCHLVLPTSATLLNLSGTARTVKLVPATRTVSMAPGAHADLKLIVNYTTAKCSRTHSDANTVTFEFGAQKLQVALPTKFQANAWSINCPTSASLTSIAIS